MKTNSGFLGLAPTRTHPGDVVCVLLGGPVPFILRENIWGHYSLVGECYVDGIMDGEALNHLRDELCLMGHTSSPRLANGVDFSSAPLEVFSII